MALDQEIRKQESGDVIIALATLTHPDLAAPIRAADNGEDVESRGETFLASGWQLRLPDEGEDADYEAEVEIENVDGAIIEALEGSTVAPQLLIEIVMSSDPDTVEVELQGYELAEVSYDATRITGRLKLPDMRIEPAPFQRFNPTVTPGLF